MRSNSDVGGVLALASVIPANQARFTLREIEAATGATVERPGGGPPGQGARDPDALGDRALRGVTTDSRGSVEGQLFVALRGEHFDGHQFIEVAVEAGASAVLVERDAALPELAVPVLRVESTLMALGELARAHRERSKAKFIAVAGSAGKTTTRTAIHALLESLAPGQVHCPPGNLNNLIGVPMVLLSAEPKHRYVVVELGTNQRGEIAKLAGIVGADLVVLTLIDLEHTEGIGGLDEVAAEEGDALAALSEAGIAVANQDDGHITSQLGRCRARTIVGFGFGSGATYQVLKRDTNDELVSSVSVKRDRGETLSFELRLLGDAGALAATAALAAVEALTGQQLSSKQVSQGLASLRVEPGRLNPIVLADTTLVIDDTYNANPASVRSSAVLAWEIAQRRGQRLVLVIGEMRELGDLSETAHSELGQALAELGPDEAIVIGQVARSLYSSLDAAKVTTHFTDDAKAAAKLLEGRLQPGDVVLVKASRGLRAEHIVQTLVERGGNAS